MRISNIKPKRSGRACGPFAPRERRAPSLVLALGIVLLARVVAAQPVFEGDPIDPSTDQPYFILPGVPLFAPGHDEKYGTKDDVLNAAIVGDVDLVLRTTPFGGEIPAPANGVAAAPVVVAGGASTGRGTDALFQIAASDGSTPPAAGHPLTGDDLDGHGVLVIAYADLDGDGHIGPRADGPGDDQIELQEILQPAARQVAIFLGGVASGDIAVSLGAPASAGGLGIVLTAAAFTGADAPLFDDGTFIATLLPFLPPLDSKRFLGGGGRPPDPNYLVDVEFELEPGRTYFPAAGDSRVGSTLAIPLDGSSVSVDLLEARAGAPVGAALARPVDASFIADGSRRLVAGPGPGGARQVREAVDSISMPDDGFGNGVSLALFAADLFGNPTDAPNGGMNVTLEAAPGLTILAPDLDGDPQRETIALSGGESVALLVDDPGGVGDGPASARLNAVVDGVVTSSIRVDLIGGGVGPTPTAPFTATPTVAAFTPTATAPSAPTRTPTLPVATSTPSTTRTAIPTATISLPPPSVASAAVLIGIRPGAKDAVRIKAVYRGLDLDPATQPLTVMLASGGETIYSRTFAAGSLSVGDHGRRFAFRDPKGAEGQAILVLRHSRRDPSVWSIDFLARALQIDGSTPGNASLVLRAGDASLEAPLACGPNRSGDATLCVR